jgi:hypothetical protein
MVIGEGGRAAYGSSYQHLLYMLRESFFEV